MSAAASAAVTNPSVTGSREAAIASKASGSGSNPCIVSKVASEAAPNATIAPVPIATAAPIAIPTGFIAVFNAAMIDNFEIVATSAGITEPRIVAAIVPSTATKAPLNIACVTGFSLIFWSQSTTPCKAPYTPSRADLSTTTKSNRPTPQSSPTASGSTQTSLSCATSRSRTRRSKDITARSAESSRRRSATHMRT